MKKALPVVLFVLSLGAKVALADGPCPAQFPTSPGSGAVAGTPLATGGTQYFFKDALLSGFDCFEPLQAFFPSEITASNSTSPTQVVVDMAYAPEGTATFSNVVVPTAGFYTLTFRYAFEQGLYPGVLTRAEGIVVNGQMITPDLSFPETGDFNTFSTVSLIAPLNAGQNTIVVANQIPQSVSRMDNMTVTPSTTGTNTCNVLPTTPLGVTAKEDSNNAIELTWTASTVPTGCTVGYYNIYRGTTPGFIPSVSNQIATVAAPTSSLSAGTSFEDTTAVCATPYYYSVQAVDFAGQSPVSAEPNASVSVCPTIGSAQIDAGSTAPVTPFIADDDFTGGSTLNHANVIDLSAVTNPAPAAAYQTARTGNFSYVLGGFAPGSSHLVRLHFAETFFSTAGSRTFNVDINGTEVLTGFDIFAAAGAKNKANIQQFTQTADANGNFTVTFTSVINSSLLSAIEVQ